MKQKLFIFLFLILMVAILAGLNAASYVQKEKTSDSEFSPNRTTFNSGATGTQAFFSLLSETGRKVTRWQEPPAALLTEETNRPAVFVVIGKLRREFTDAETEQLLRWVSGGGRLILIDREPAEGLVTTTANWRIFFTGPDTPAFFPADPTYQLQMTANVPAIKAVQPSVLTQSVNAVQPSILNASIAFERYTDNKTDNPGSGIQNGPQPPRMENPPANNGRYIMPTPMEPLPMAVDNVESPSQLAPVVHFANGPRNLVVDAPFGEGRIVFLSDPYIVSNAGIALTDNSQLAINLVAGGDGLVAFDEYHQGYGTDNDRFLQFFEGTPLVAIFLQSAILIGLVFFSQSRRFARPVPEPEPDRLSKLEYVAAMAELQNRTKAFDLAIENIYNDFRRRATRLLALDNYTAKSGDIAKLIAERSGLNWTEIADTLFKCEEIIRGEPTNKREVLRLADELRSIEDRLGLTRVPRTRI